MAETVSDLLVRIRPDGIDETADQLEQTQGAFEETADVAGEGAAQLEEFAQRWEGAMVAITAALLAGAGVLLSQVPVLGESMAGLNAIIDAFALRLDSVLRPAIGGANNSLFEFANTVATADGALGMLFDAISVVVGIGGPLLVAIAAIGSQMGTWSSTIAGVSAMLSTLVGWIGTVISAIGSFLTSTATIVVALGTLIGTLGVVILEVSGVLDAVQRLGSEMSGPGVKAALALASVLTAGLLPALATLGAAIVGFVRGTLEGGLSEGFRRAKTNATQAFDTMAELITDTLSGLSEGFRRAKTNATRAFDTMAELITGTLSALASSALGFGRSLVNGLIRGIRDRISDARRAAERLAGAVRRHLPSSPAQEGPLSDLDDVGPGLVEEVASGMERSVGRIEAASGQVAMAADPRDRVRGAGGGRGGGGSSGRSAVNRQLSQLVAAMQQRRQETVLQLDGKTVARQLEPLLGEGAVTSGATQVRR